MSSVLETGNVDDAAKTLHDIKPPKRYVECNNNTNNNNNKIKNLYITIGQFDCCDFVMPGCGLRGRTDGRTGWYKPSRCRAV